MSMATRTYTRSPELHAADRHDVIRVHGARVNNLKDVSVEIPKRRLTVFTGVSGSGKSSLVFGTIAAESQRLINETYSAFVQGFMPSLARPEVDVLDGLTTAIIVDQERMGADPRSTVGTATDANAMLRILFSRLGEPHIGPPPAFSFNVPTRKASGAMTVEKGKGERIVVRDAVYHGGMCQRCEGRGSVTDVDLTQLYDEGKSLNEGALTIPGYSMEGWYGRILRGCGFFDPDKPIRAYTEKELHDLLHKEPTKIKVDGINLTYAGLIPTIRRSFLSKDVDALQPHIRAFVERVVTFTACPDCGGTRLNEAARSSRIGGKSIADVCAMQISDLAGWVRGLGEPSVAPLLTALGETLDSFVEIGLGYLALDRPAGTLSGGEAQRTRMIRALGSSLTDVTYVFDEPTAGLHPHDVQRMNDLLVRLRDKGNTVLVVEHEPEVIAIADHVVDLGPVAGTAGGEVVFEGPVDGLRASGTLTGRHLDDRASVTPSVRPPTGMLEVHTRGTPPRRHGPPIENALFTVGEGGLEPPRGCPHWHLKPARLPFRHSPEWNPHATGGVNPVVAGGQSTFWAALARNRTGGRPDRGLGRRPPGTGRRDARWGQRYNQPATWSCSPSSADWSVWSLACSPEVHEQASVRSSSVAGWCARWTINAPSTSRGGGSSPTTSSSNCRRRTSRDSARSPTCCRPSWSKRRGSTPAARVTTSSDP